MDLIIHDAKLKKVAYIDNELQDTLSFYDDKWSRYLDTASSTFEFTVYKNGIKSDTVKQKAYQTLTERSFVSFKYNKRTYLFNVMKTEETETTIRCYCENLNLELLNEMAGPYKAKTEMSFVEYCNTFFLLVGGAITIGHNEIEDRERTLEWTGTDTKLKRLLSIANQFDAEIEFETILDEDSSLKSFILNIYKENDDKNQGVGKVRQDVVLRHGHNITGVKRTIDKTGIFNMITPVGKATVDVKVTKANPKYVAPKLNAVTYSGGSLSNGGRTISKSLVNEILNLCVQHKLLPSGVFSQMYLESFWGNSPVARADNNWGGLTWTGSTTRPSGIKVTQGTARPANEGGYYMHFASVSDYMKDYTYLLAEQGIYKVKGANNIDAYTKGLFRVGGAAYDYAAAGYGHYAPLMRSIRGGINSASNGAMDTLDNQFKTAGTVGTAPVSQIATKTKDALAQLGAIKGQRVGSGQCYALSALYSLKLGGAGLGGGVTGFRGVRPGGGAAASHIGEDYNWDQFGWKVVRPSEVKHLIPGSIANIRANAGSPVYTGGWGHTVVIKALSGDTLTVYEQNFAGHQYVEERTYSASAYLGVIQTLVYPPEIVQGKRIDGTESAPVQSGTPGNNEPKTISETQQQEKTVGIPNDLYREWKNEDGVVEFYIKNGSIYAPISKELYPSAFSGEEVSDNWIKKSVEYETIDIEQIISYSLQDIRKNCYPSISYEVKGTDENLDMGDTVKIDDEEFPEGLVLSARVSEQHISFTNDSTNQTIFDNYKALKNKLSKDLIDRYEELAEQAKPYELRLLTDKGTQFKNSTGLSVLTAELWKNNKQYDATFQFRNFDTLLASGLTYTVDGSTIPIDKPFLISVDAFIGNDLVATKQITFTNVTDGTDGIGIKSSSVMHGISTSATVQPTNWTEAMPVAKQGEYLWKRKITDYTDPSKPDTIELTYSYQGKNGSAGTSVSVTKIEYQVGTSGTTAPTGTWSTAIPSVPDGQFLWSKTTMSDNSVIYGINKQGAKGDKGDTYYPHTAWANSEDGKVDFSTTESKGRRYKGDYSDTNVAGSPDPTKYKWVDMVGGVESGGTNVYSIAGNATIGKSHISDLNMDISTGVIRFVASGPDPFIGVVRSHPFVYNNVYGIKIPVVAGKDIAVTITNPKITKNYVSYFTNDGKTVKQYKGYFASKFIIPKPELAGVDFITMRIGAGSSNVSIGDVFETKIQAEYGNIYSDWSPADEDVRANIDTKADQALTQDQLNLLLETQNLMTAEMKSKATAEQADSLLATVNKILSDSAITGADTEAKLIANAERIEAFRKDFDDKMVQLDFVSNYMRVTDLGFEISANDGSSSLLIQKDRISMLSAGKEVMYISQGLIHIDNGVFTKTLQIGNFRESQADGDPTTNLEIYVG
ncbi:hypothetical protein BI362_03175 [Streptococcus parauberis]|nr:hypothetical protein BI362_03175 [Streptococcus parauberis]QBX18290.1 tail fibers protein [Streptococcus phage Javan407]